MKQQGLRQARLSATYPDLSADDAYTFQAAFVKALESQGQIKFGIQ